MSLNDIAKRSGAITLTAALAIALAFMVWANLLASHIDRPLIDEEIVVAVLDHLSTEQTLDTNWANVENVARSYPSNQYNFSAAILAYGLASGELVAHEAMTEIHFRHVPVLFSGGALLVFFLAFGALGGRVAALVAIVLAALSYQFLSEAVSIRPEAFISLVYAATLGAAVWKRPPLALSAFAIGVGGGLLIATKFSLVLVWAQAFVLMLIIRLALSPDLASLRTHWRPTLVMGAVSLAGCVGGIALGAPYALMDLPATAEGMGALIAQYGNAHYPFGRPDSGPLMRAGHALVQTQSHLGALTLLLCLAGTGLALRERHWPIAFMALSTLAIIGYFAVKPVFFARNISLFIPVLAFLAGWAALNLASRFAYPWRKAGFACLAIALMVQPLIASRAFSAAVISYEQRQQVQSVSRGFLEVQTGREARPVNGWDAYRDPARILAGADNGEPALVELRSLNDPFTRSVLQWLSDAPHAAIHAPGTARLEHFPHSMVHYNFDINHNFLWVDPAGAAPLPDLVQEDAWCRETLDADIHGSFSAEGFHGESRPDFAAFGSWLGSDGAVAAARLRLDSIPEDTVLPILTGPGRGGLTLSIDGAEQQAVFTDGVWIGLALPASPGSVEITIEDNGTGWGEWMAFGYPRQTCR